MLWNEEIEIDRVSNITESDNGIGADQKARQSTFGSEAQDGSDLLIHNRSAIAAQRRAHPHSHSIVLGGLVEMS